MSTQLYEQINYAKAYRKNRLNAAHWVLANPHAFEELLAYCFDKEQTAISHKAAWVLEFVCLEDLGLLYPYLDSFFGKLHLIKKHQSLRPFSHICELLMIEIYKNKNRVLAEKLSEKHKKIMTELCFDWLISDQKVACQVRAMTALCYLGREYLWIHPELQQIVMENSHQSSAAYKARGRWVLKEIAKINSKR